MRLHARKIPVARINNFANALCELKDIPFDKCLLMSDLKQKAIRTSIWIIILFRIRFGSFKIEIVIIFSFLKFWFLILYVQIASKYLKYRSDLFKSTPGINIPVKIILLKVFSKFVWTIMCGKYIVFSHLSLFSCASYMPYMACLLLKVLLKRYST